MHSAASSEMSLFWSYSVLKPPGPTEWIQCGGPTGRGGAVLEEHPRCTASQQGWEWAGPGGRQVPLRRELPERRGGGGGVYMGCFHVWSNCKPAEEQTWPLSLRERQMWIGVSAKKTKPETLYIMAAVKSDAVAWFHVSSMSRQSSWLLQSVFRLLKL